MNEAWDDRDADIMAIGKSTNFALNPHPQISVMLPTYKRLDALGRTLSALENQSLSKTDYEVVVVDDGSRDGTGSFLKNFAKLTDLSFLSLMLKENGGPARARNFGLSRCRAEVVLIIGDDIEPEPDLVAIHLRSHDQTPDTSHAVLGHVCFPSELEPSAFMQWLELGGRKYFFNYQDLVPGQEAGPLFFYTCNVSVKKQLLDTAGWFDESFPYASHEDLELGYRLAARGMKMIYEPQAAGRHFHLLTIQGVTRRIYLMGFSAELFWQKVGDRGGMTRRALRKMISAIASTLPGVALWKRLAGKKFAEDEQHKFQWHMLLFLSFFIGLSDSKRGKGPRV